MRTTVISLFLLCIAHGINSQLNFEGNPLTEDTVYTAEESHLSEKARSLEIENTEDSYLLAAKSLQAERAQNHHHDHHDNHQQHENVIDLKSRDEAGTSFPESSPKIYRTLTEDVLKNPAGIFETRTEVQQQQQQQQQHQQQHQQQNNFEIPSYQKNVDASMGSAEFSERSPDALAMFLNSKTPEESRAALEEYLDGQRSVESSSGSSGARQPHITEIILPQQEQQQQSMEIGQGRYSLSEYSNPQSQIVVGRNINQNLAVRPGRQGPLLLPGASPSLLARRNFVVRGPTAQYLGPVYQAQSRKGDFRYQKGIHRGSFPPGVKPGVEIIYTKPPGGFGGNRYSFRKSPNPYEDASAWFPEADHPPPDTNIYHSQLYAQSYDPYYYAYIAKYGKIKPHLYGKLGKKEEESFLSELFSSFKKHGMKHVMHPMFLLGLGIPMVTLMLSALVSNRSLARSSTGSDGDHVTDEDIDEWIAKLRKALECYSGSGSGYETDINKCSVFD